MFGGVAVVALGCVTAALGAPPVEIWTHAFGSEGVELGFGLAAAPGGGYALAGVSDTLGDGVEDMYVVRADADGDVVWARTYGGAAEDRGHAIAGVPGGGFVLAGRTTGTGPDPFDVSLVRIDADGTLVWSRRFGGAEADEAWAVASVDEDAGGGFVIAGDTHSFAPPGASVYVIRTDADGAPMWERAFGGGDLHARSVAPTPDGGFIVAGFEGDGRHPPSYDARVLKLDADGDLEWERTWDRTVDDRANAVVVAPDGGYAVGGLSLGASLWKTDAAGMLAWQEVYPGSNEARSLATTSSGGYLLGGIVWRGGERGYDAHVIETDDAGQLAWELTLGGTAWDWATSALETAEGEYIVGGTTASVGAGGYDMLLVRLGPADLPADLDGDGLVGFADLLLLLSAWGDCPEPPAECPADLNGDGTVGFTDLLILLGSWT